MNFSSALKAILIGVIAHLPVSVNAGKIDGCTKQSSCFDLIYEPACDNNCGVAGECDWKICLTTTYGGECAKTTTETVSHTCKKEECASSNGFADTIDGGGFGEIANVGDGDVQCQIVGAGENVEFLLKDAGQCSDSFAGVIGGLSSQCNPRDSNTDTCTGNAVGVECIWTVTAPSAVADCSTCSPTPPTTPTTPTDTINPTSFPTDSPTESLTAIPTGSPTDSPTDSPTKSPTAIPTDSPTVPPTDFPTASPTNFPSSFPSSSPSSQPSSNPSASPSSTPSASPSSFPSSEPSVSPSLSPSAFPSSVPSMIPSAHPSNSPSAEPSAPPSISMAPSSFPSSAPSMCPVTNIDPAPKKNTCFVNALNSPTCNSGNCKEVYLMGTSGIEDNFFQTEDGLYAPTDTCSESGQALSNIVTFNYCKCDKTEDENAFATFPVDLINRSAIKKCGTKCYVYGFIDLDKLECDGNAVIIDPHENVFVHEEEEEEETAAPAEDEEVIEDETTVVSEPTSSEASSEETCGLGSCSLCQGRNQCVSAGCVFRKGQCTEGSDSGKTTTTMRDAICNVISDLPSIGGFLCP